MFKHKKGVELSVNVIIIIILAVLVLVVVAVIFTGGTTTLWERIRGIYGGQPVTLQAAVIDCNGFCQGYMAASGNIEDFRTNFCNDEKFGIDTDGDGKADPPKRGCVGLGVSCPAIDCG